MKIPKPYCLSPGDFTDVEQFFAITIIFKSMSFSVFTLAWPIETVPQSKLRGPLLCSSGFLLWADHKEAFFAGNDLLNSLVKYPSNIPYSPVWCFSFTTLGKSLLQFSALNSFLHCLFLLPGTIRLVWLGFA